MFYFHNPGIVIEMELAGHLIIPIPGIEMEQGSCLFVLIILIITTTMFHYRNP